MRRERLTTKPELLHGVSRLPASCIEHRLEFGVTKPAIVSCVVSAVREWTQLYYHVNQVRRRNVLLNFVKSRARPVEVT